VTVPKIAAELSALAVARLKDEGDHQVGGVAGLMLRIDGNSRAWVLRIRLDGRRRNLGLGPYPEVTLAQARDLAREKRNRVRTGSTEQLSRRDEARHAKAVAVQAMTFKQAGKAYIEAMQPTWKNEKHAQQWENTLTTYAYPMIGGEVVPTISTAMVLDVLKPIWYTKPETASRVRGRIEAVIDFYAAVNHLKMNNPARWKGLLDKLLPHKAKVKKVQHHKAVPWRSAPDAAKVIQGRRGIAAKALQAVILTACRHSEVTGMVKGEIDWQAGLWVIPAERMKVPRDHVVPMSTQLVALLKSVGADQGAADELVFASSQASRQGAQLADTSLVKVMRDHSIDATTHGWRSTFKDWASEATTYPNELSEMALAHAIENKAEAAYRRGDLVEKRRPLMQEWADYVLPIKCD